MANARKNLGARHAYSGAARWRWPVISAGAAILLLFSPLVSGVNNLGTWFGMGMGLVIAGIGWLLLWIVPAVGWLWGRRAGRAALTVFGALLAAFVIWALSLIGLMISRAAAGGAPEGATVIVLGCKVNGETPSRALTQRLEAALGYLQAHPGAVCILSGGQGNDEAISEAEAMRRYLTAQGIDEERLIREECSTDTRENLRCSAALIEEKGLSKQVVLVTHSYHQCRAALEAEDVGLTPYAVNAASSIQSYPTFFLRDLLGVAHKTVFG